MAEKIDLSLDDIIKTNKARKGPGNTRGRGRGGGRGRGQNQAIGRSRSRSRGPVQAQGKSRSRSRGRVAAGGKGGRGGRRIASAGARRPGLVTSSGPGKLIISNLDLAVSDTDIQELFGEFGTIKSASLHYDRGGKSLGTADVVYTRRSDAIKGERKYFCAN